VVARNKKREIVNEDGNPERKEINKKQNEKKNKNTKISNLTKVKIDGCLAFPFTHSFTFPVDVQG
jgi:hypothetical protein